MLRKTKMVKINTKKIGRNFEDVLRQLLKLKNIQIHNNGGK